MEENKKISVEEYINNKELLELTYIPFNAKLDIISTVINNVIQAVGGFNSSLLRRIFIEAIIDAVTNIDMEILDENNLKGFDQLCLHNELDNLISSIGHEYIEFKKIFDERVSDYIRTETNQSVIINMIYNEIKAYINAIIGMISDRMQNIDVEKLGDVLTHISNNEDGVQDEG